MLRRALVSLACLLPIAGCLDSGAGANVTFVEAKGKVTYQGSPLSGANVMFVPEQGPIALGVTDAEGNFTLRSGGINGVAVGESKVAVSVPSDGGSSGSDALPPKPTDEASGRAYMEAMTKMAKERAENKDAPPKPKSLIPEKYTAAATSGLKATVTSEPSKNVFTFDLK